jgi:hypothetical protein
MDLLSQNTFEDELGPEQQMPKDTHYKTNSSAANCK